MITLKQFLETIDYRITEGSEFHWQCYGPNAYCLDSWDGKHDDGTSFQVTFDRDTQTVYQVEAHDFGRRKAYRYINPEFANAHRDEAFKRGVDADEAYDDVKFVDLEVEEDWLEKAHAIANGESYDERVSIPLDLEHNELFKLMTLAHEQDITLNQLMVEILTEAMNRRQQCLT